MDETKFDQGTKNNICVIGTSNCYKRPWLAPVKYWTDEHCIYFQSHKDSKHILDIKTNPLVSVLIDVPLQDCALQMETYAQIIKNEDPFVTIKLWPDRDNFSLINHDGLKKKFPLLKKSKL